MSKKETIAIILCLFIISIGCAKAQWGGGSGVALANVSAWFNGVAPNATTTTDTSGNWSITFPTMASSTPTVEVMPLSNNTTTRINCKVKTRSSTTQTDYCWTDNAINVTLVSLTLLGIPVPWQSGTVMVIAREPTQ